MFKEKVWCAPTVQSETTVTWGKPGTRQSETAIDPVRDKSSLFKAITQPRTVVPQPPLLETWLHIAINQGASKILMSVYLDKTITQNIHVPLWS